MREDNPDGVAVLVETTPEIESTTVDPTGFYYDVFISFRHRDARVEARKLRLRLLGDRLPAGVAAKVAGQLRIYVDTYETQATDDYWTKSIEPALKRSRYLIVLVSPSVYEPAPDGSQNWVVREIAAFLSTSQRNNIIPIFTRSNKTKTLPNVLARAMPRLQAFDLGTEDRFLPTLPFLETAAQLALLKVVAAVRGVAPADLPRILQEDLRRRIRWLVMAGSAGLVVLVMVSIAAVLAVLNGAAAARSAGEVNLQAALDRAVDRPDEASLYAWRALAAVSATFLSPLLGDEQQRIRDVLAAIELPRSTITWVGGRVASLTTSPDGTRIVVWTENNRLLILASSNLAVTAALDLPELKAFAGVTAGPDGILIVDLNGRTIVHLRYDGIIVARRDFPDKTTALPAGHQHVVVISTGGEGMTSLLDVPTGNEIRLLTGPIGRIQSAAYVPGAKRVVLHSDWAIGVYEQRLFDAETGAPVGSLGLTHQVSPNPVVDVQAGIVHRHAADGAIVRVSLLNGIDRTELRNVVGLSASLSSSADGFVVVQRNWESGLVELWDGGTGRQLAPPLSPYKLNEEPVFSPSRRRVLLLTSNEAMVIDRAAPQDVGRLPLGDSARSGLFLDESRVAVADGLGRVSVWDIETRQAIMQGVRHHEGMVQLALAADGRLVSSGWDGSIRLTVPSSNRGPDWTTGRVSEDLSTAVNALAVHPFRDEVAAAIGSHGVRACDIGGTNCRWQWTTQAAVRSLAYVNSGKSLLVSLAETGASLRDVDSGAEIEAFPKGRVAGQADGEAIAIAENGKRLIVRRSRNSSSPTCESGEAIASPWELAFGANGTLLAVLSQPSPGRTRVALFDVRTCREIWSKMLPSAAHLVQISSRLGLVVAGGGGGAMAFHLANGTPTGLVADDRNMATSLSFHPRRSILLTTGASRRITALDTVTGAPMFSPIVRIAQPWQGAYSPSGYRIAVAYLGTDPFGRFFAELFDAQRGLPLSSPIWHPRDVMALGFTRNGKWLVTACGDGLIRAWRQRSEERSPDEIGHAITASTGQTIDDTSGAIRALHKPDERRPAPVNMLTLPSLPSVRIDAGDLATAGFGHHTEPPVSAEQ